MLCRKVTYLIFSEYFSSINNNARCMAKWASRKPTKIIPSEEYDEEEDAQIKTNPKAWEGYFENKSKVRPLTISKKETVSKITIDMLETTVDESGNFIYTKMKDNDSRITTILTEIKSKNDRDKKDLILLEGKRLIKDALDSKCNLKYILFSRFNELNYLRPSLPNIGAKLYKMPYKEIQMWSNLTTSPGIMGIFKTPDIETYEPPQDSLPLTVICDNIREADNLGAVLRTCSGVGCKEILLTKGCVNVWDSKVLRSASGAHFKLRVRRKLNWDHFDDYIPPGSNIFIAENKLFSFSSTDENTDKELMSKLVESVPLVPYFGVNFNQGKHNVLIVGGETEGISQESYMATSKLNGTRLNIPLGNNVDSLNVGTALGILVFEIKRQHLISQCNNST